MEKKIVHCTMDGWYKYWILLVHFLRVSCKSQSNRQCVKDLKLQCHSKGNYSAQRNGFLSLNSAAFSLAVRTNARQRGFNFVSVIMSYKSWRIMTTLHSPKNVHIVSWPQDRMLTMLPFIHRFSQHSVVHMDINVQSTFMELFLHAKPLFPCNTKRLLHISKHFIFAKIMFGNVLQTAPHKKTLLEKWRFIGWFFCVTRVSNGLGLIGTFPYKRFQILYEGKRLF